MYADPFGVNAIDCFMANNEAMNNQVLPLTDRSIQVIQQGYVNPYVYRPSQMQCAFDDSVISGKPEVYPITSQW